MSYRVYVILLPSQAALDAPSLVFLRLAGTCSLNHSYSYAFGPRIKYGAGSGTCQPQKSGAIIASIGEICGLWLSVMCRCQ